MSIGPEKCPQCKASCEFREESLAFYCIPCKQRFDLPDDVDQSTRLRVAQAKQDRLRAEINELKSQLNRHGVKQVCGHLMYSFPLTLGPFICHILWVGGQVFLAITIGCVCFLSALIGFAITTAYLKWQKPLRRRLRKQKRDLKTLQTEIRDLSRPG